MRGQGWMLGVLAVGLLAGCNAMAQEQTITLTIHNHDTGEPVADVRVDQYRRKTAWVRIGRVLMQGPFSLISDFYHATTKQTDKKGTVVFKGNPREGWYDVYSNTRSALRFNLNGEEIVSHVNAVHRNRINVFIVGYNHIKQNEPRTNLYVSGTMVAADVQTAYIGTQTGDSGSGGIYRIRVDKTKGIVGKPERVAEVDNPSFLKFSRQGLHVVSEALDKVLVYDVGDVGEETGMITLREELETGAGPCYLAFSYYLTVVANYTDGSVTVWRHEGAGKERQKSTLQYTHASKATDRQQQPHPHSVAFSGNPHWMLVPDFGADRVYVYKTNWTEIYSSRRRLEPHEAAPWIELPPGRGPRRVAFSWHTYPKDPDSLYVLNELSNTISVFDYDKKEGLFTFIEEVSTLPERFKGQSAATEIIVWGDVLYVINRGHDSIARFKRDLGTGRLTLMECTPCGGKGPSHFAMMQDRGPMLVANQHSNYIAVFRVGKDGALTRLPRGGVKIGAPACVVF